MMGVGGGGVCVWRGVGYSTVGNSLYCSINIGGNRAVLVLCAILRVHQ